uniref:CCR4-NOT transcription complex subunit 1 CAF1-binding domain-containing protein n=1 Tax=Sipha flava TaxID=143950 RepID=A0A2S2R3N8_9HEMI
MVATVVPSSDASAGLSACAENVEGTITSLMALPFTPTKTPEDDYAEKIIITMTCLHELNVRGKFQHIKNLLNSHERMVWFAKFLVTHHVSRVRSNHGFYSRLMQYVGSDFLNGLILSETYRAI